MIAAVMRASRRSSTEACQSCSDCIDRSPRPVGRAWLQHELLEVLKELPEASIDRVDLPQAAEWAKWLGHVPDMPLPPLRLILVWDNLAGHLSTSIVTWLFASRSDAAVHTSLRLVAEYGGVRPTHHLRASVEWAASTECGAA